MPVTAKLSRRFYEQFGDELTNELVEWFNAVDATYRSDLRDVNEANFARFDAKVGQRAAELDRKIDRVAGQVNAKIDQLHVELDAKIDQRCSALDAKIDLKSAELREAITAQLASVESRMMRWMFTLWTTSMVAMAAGFFAVLRSR
ncbi:MAG TPA: hypothetical protein VGM67_18685 [Gemmatimonadaceae bacterium]